MITSTRTKRPEPNASAPLVTQAYGSTKAEMLAEIDGTVVGVERSRNATYLRIRSATAESVIERETDLMPVECEPAIRCLGAILSEPTPESSPSRTPGKSAASRPHSSNSAVAQVRARELVVRLAESQSESRLSSVTLRASRGDRGGVVQRIRLKGLAEAPAESGLMHRFFTAWSKSLRSFGEGEPFAEFAAARIEQHELAGKAPQLRAGSRPAVRTELRDLMNFYTGRSEIQRALQTDRGLGTRLRSTARTIEMDSLTAVSHEPRDYSALLQGDPSVGHFLPHPLAKVAPDDAILVEFASFRDLLTLPHQLDARLGHLTQALEGQPGPNELLEGYRAQLMLEQTGLAEKLGHLAVGAAVMILGDPYLREGTDISLVLQVKERNLLEPVLVNFVKNARERRPDLATTTATVAGIPVTSHMTQDRRLCRHEAWLGSELVLSNSARALARIISVHQGKAASVADSADYRWARSMANFSAEAERAYAFFGDRFVEKITGPRSKILESRRTRAQAELRSVEYSALLYAILYGAPPSSLEEFLASGYLTKADLVHFDGTPIQYDPSLGARSAYGAADHLVPIVDLEVGKVDKEEASAYAQFRDSYEREWSGALDPTGLRLLRSARDEDWDFELRILPLSPGGDLGREFREILRTVGRGAVQAGRGPSGLRAVVGMSQQSKVRDLALGPLLGWRRNRDLGLGFVGDWAEIGVADDPWLWNFALAENLLPEREHGATDRDRFGVERNPDRLPVWAAIHVKNPLLLTAALTALRAYSLEAMGDWVTWHDGDKYRDLSLTRVEIRAGNGDAPPISVYFTTVKDVLVVSVDRSVFERRVDELMDGVRPKGVKESSGESQLVFDFNPRGGHYLSDILAGVLDQPGIIAHRRACIALTLLGQGLGEPAVNSNQRIPLGLRFLGYVPDSPGGSELRLAQGQCQHPVYGSLLEPMVPDARDQSLPVHATVSSLESAQLGLAVIPRAAEQELVLRTQLHWR